MTRATRIPSAMRKKLILKAAMKVSQKTGYNKISRDKVAEVAKIASSLISAHFPKIEDLRTAVLQKAVLEENVIILAQAFALRDSRIAHTPPALKRKINQYLSSL